MVERLQELHKNSYSPYSHFAVSAILITKDGREFVGVNVENAAYGSSICAERSAILSAISNGCKKGDFKELHIMTSSTGIGMPCFACRQVISELFDKDALVRCYSINGNYEDYTVEQICPYPFGESDLENA